MKEYEIGCQYSYIMPQIFINSFFKKSTIYYKKQVVFRDNQFLSQKRTVFDKILTEKHKSKSNIARSISVITRQILSETSKQNWLKQQPIFIYLNDKNNTDHTQTQHLARNHNFYFLWEKEVRGMTNQKLDHSFDESPSQQQPETAARPLFWNNRLRPSDPEHWGVVGLPKRNTFRFREWLGQHHQLVVYTRDILMCL